MTIEYAEVPSVEGWTSYFIPVEEDDRGKLYLETNRPPETEADMETARLLAQGIDPETGDRRRSLPILAHERWVRDLERAEWVRSVVFHS